MTVINTCDQCQGEIEFNEADAGAPSICPLCTAEIVLRIPTIERATRDRTHDTRTLSRMVTRVRIASALNIAGGACAIAAILLAHAAHPACIALAIAALSSFATAWFVRPAVLRRREKEKKREATEATLESCKDCGETISRHARACPKCGAPGAKKRSLFVVSGLLFGTLGIHNFYIGRHGIGAIQLLITIFGFGFGGVILTAIWALLEIMFIGRDASGRALR